MKHIQINHRQNQKENAIAVKRGRIWINYHGKCNQVKIKNNKININKFLVCLHGEYNILV